MTAVNDAPVLADTALTLTVAEDAGAPSGAVGSLISAFTGGSSDVDSSPSKGIAITGTVETNGLWYYSINSGSNWSLVGAVNNTSALLLADNGSTRLYFAPAANFNGASSAALTLRAWDQTSGSAASKVTTATNGGTSAFSSATDVIDVTVTAVSDAPVLADTALTLTVAEDAGTPSGAVGSLISAFTGGSSDVDSSPSKGIAITGTVESNGTWYYSVNSGSNWSLVGAVNNTSALLLADDGNTYLYFAPAANFNGASAGALTLRAWDQTSGSAGNKVSTASNGGATAFSSATDVIDVTVTAVNDAPAVSTTVSTLAFTENDAATAVDAGLTITDIDSATLASATVSITANYAATQDQLLFFSQNGISGQWNASTGVLTLSGTATVAQYQAALRSVVYAKPSDTPSTAARTVAFAVNDGALASNTATRSLSVSAVNDAPDFKRGDGLLVTNVTGSNTDFANAVLVQPDGKTVMGGYTQGANKDFVLARYNADGSLDSGFGTGGIVTTALGPSDDQIENLVQMSDGRILAVGTSYNGSASIALAMYLPNGSLDTSFGGGDGMATAQPGGSATGFGAAVQADGKILVAAQGNNDFRLVRFNTDGSLDTAFGSSGAVSTDLGSSSSDYTRSVAVQKRRQDCAGRHHLCIG